MAWQRWLGAFLAGAIVPLAFAPFELYPVILLSLTVLFALWRTASPAESALLGFLFGLGQFGAGVSWIFISIYEHGHVPLLLSLFLTALFILVLALFPALAGYLSARILYRRHDAFWRLALVFPVIWVLVEWLRGWFLTGFPWLNVGYSQLEAPLVGLAPVLGVYGVSWAVALTAALLLGALAQHGGRIQGRYMLAAVLLWWLAGGLRLLDWTHPVDAPVKVSLIQGNIPQDLKWLSSMRQPTLELYSRLTAEHWDSDLIVWPETAMPLFSYQAQPVLQALAAEARRQQSDVLLGLVFRESTTASYFNSMIGLGRTESVYHKRHLVPFTEYLPLQSVLAGVVDLLDVPMSDFSRGDDSQQPMPLAGQAIGISICYEDAFGEEVIRQLPEATLLINVSNDAWFTGSLAPAQHLQMAQMRAIETGRVLLRATNTGISAVIDESGRIRQRLPQDELAVLTATVQPRGGATPYVRAGNGLVLTLLGVGLLAGMVTVRRRH